MATIETRILSCGKMIYAKLVVPHDWNPKPLNPCACGGSFDRWSIGTGHQCSRCEATCTGECRIIKYKGESE